MKFQSVREAVQFHISDNIVHNVSRRDQLVVPSLKGYSILKWNEIVYLKAAGNYTCILCSDNKVYCYSKTLKHVSSKIKSNTFLRCHRSFLINTVYLKEIRTSSLGFQCILEGNKIIPVSRSKKSLVVKWIKSRL